MNPSFDVKGYLVRFTFGYALFSNLKYVGYMTMMSLDMCAPSPVLVSYYFGNSCHAELLYMF